MPSKPKVDATLPAVPGATLDLHWSDFKKLLERRAAVVAPQQPEAPPVEFIVGPAEVTGDITVGPHGLAQLKATFDLRVLASAWVSVPLLDGDLALQRAQLDGEELALDPEESNPLVALVKGPCERKVTLQFAATLLTEAEQSGIGFELPSAPVVNLAVKIARTGIEAEVEPSVSVNRAEQDGVTLVKASIPGGQTVRLSWTRAREVVREKPLEPPQLFARTEALVSVGDGLAKSRVTTTINVLKAPVRQFFFAVPNDATVADVQGPQVASWEILSGSNPQQVAVELRSEFKGTTLVSLELDRPWDDKPPVKLPLTRMMGVERESGFVAVAAATAIELTPAETVNLVRVDIKELPPSLTSGPHPAVLAYKFREAGGALSVGVQRHADLPVVTAMADTVEHVVLLTADGKRVSRSSYSIRNAQRQFVRLKLPEGAQVWSTLLDGSAVKPAAGADGQVLVPLKKAASLADAERPFVVEVVTMAETPALSEKGKLKVPLPTCDLPTGALRFSLWLPEGFLYDDFSGSLEEVRGFRDPWSPEGTVSQAMQHLSPPKAQPMAPPPPASPPPPPPLSNAAVPVNLNLGGLGNVAAAAAGPGMDLDQIANERFGSADGRRRVAFQVSEAEVQSTKLAKKARPKVAREKAKAEPEAEEYAPSDDMFEGEPPSEPPLDLYKRIAGAKDAGVLPVRMEVPEKGLCYAFEKLLVLDEVLFVETEYAKEKVSK
jgi:hypothetical protein